MKVQIEESNDYRYSLIIPAISNMTNPIEQNDHYFNLISSTDLKNVILLTWDIYIGDDFYSYEIWRTDIESMDIESLEDNGEKLVEIIAL